MGKLLRSEWLRLLAPGLGRQMFSVFVGCALIPILVLSLLSWERVGSELETQSRVRLHHVARRTGMMVLERLANIEAMLASAGAHAVDAGGENRIDHRLLSLHREGAGARTVLGSPTEARPEPRPDLDPARAHLSVVDQEGEVAVWLRTATDADGGRWLARLAPDFLFDISHENALSPGGEACIVTSEGQAVWSSHPDLGCAPAAGVRTGTPALEQRTLDGEAYLAIDWKLFLTASYQEPGWTVVVAEPESLAMGPVHTFRMLVLLVSALTLSIVALFAARLIRRQLAPLASLEAAANRVRSGELGVTVPVASSDELGRVSAAFNQMSDHLAAQFSSLESLIETDRAILAATTQEMLIASALDAIEEIGGLTEIGIALRATFDDSGDAWNIVRRSPERPDLTFEFPRWLITTAEWYDYDKGVIVVPTSDLEPELGQAVGAEDGFVEFYPLSANQRWLGMVTRGLSARQSRLGGTASLQIRQLCDQIASAVHGLQLRLENEQLRQFDATTGLPNRESHQERLAEAIRASRGKPLSVTRVTITGMARYANTYGQEGSETVLRDVAVALRAVEGIDLARVDSVSFGVFFVAPDMEAIIARIRSLLALVRGSLEDRPGAHGLGVVIGATLQGLDGVEAHDLIRKADVASRQVSGVGVDAIEFFSDEMERSFKKTSELEASLEHAIEAGELRLEYQPIVDVQTRQLVAGEALIRWTSPLRGPVPPDVFIPIAEESGLIQRLSDWVIERAFADVAGWRESGLVPVRVSVNMPASQFSSRLAEKIADLIRDGRARPEDIGIELTESDQLAESERAQQVLAEIRGMGLTVSIDDFGTGYSSLEYLRRFKVDVVKIDRTFLQGVPDDEGDCDLTRAAIAVGRALGLRTVAEGCETEAQLRFLRESDCDAVQGYLFGASMSTTDFAKLIHDANRGVGLDF